MNISKLSCLNVSKRAIALVSTVCICLAFALYGCSSGESVKNSVEEYSWGELSKISEEIGKASSEDAAVDIAKKYNLTNSNGQLDGTQVKDVQLSNGQTVQVQIAGFWHDDKTSGGKAGITFIFKDAIAEHSMNPTETNAGGWENSQMRSWLATDGMNMLPSELSSKIVEVSKMTNNTGETMSVSSVTSTSDKLWLFSETELYGTDIGHTPEYVNDIEKAEGIEYKLFRDQAVGRVSSNSSLTKTYRGSSCTWFERSACPNNPYHFCIVNDRGGSTYGCVATRVRAVVPGFSI